MLRNRWSWLNLRLHLTSNYKYKTVSMKLAIAFEIGSKIHCMHTFIGVDPRSSPLIMDLPCSPFSFFLRNFFRSLAKHYPSLNGTCARAHTMILSLLYLVRNLLFTLRWNGTSNLFHISLNAHLVRNNQSHPKYDQNLNSRFHLKLYRCLTISFYFHIDSKESTQSNYYLLTPWTYF